MKKLVKLPLPVDGVHCKSIADVQENFNIYDLLAHFESGKLGVWLKSRQFDQCEAIQAIDKFSEKKAIAKKLYEAFNVGVDEGEILDAIMLLEYESKYDRKRVELDKIKVIFDSHKKELSLEFEQDMEGLRTQLKGDLEQLVSRPCVGEDTAGFAALSILSLGLLAPALLNISKEKKIESMSETIADLVRGIEELIKKIG